MKCKKKIIYPTMDVEIPEIFSCGQKRNRNWKTGKKMGKNYFQQCKILYVRFEIFTSVMMMMMMMMMMALSCLHSAKSHKSNNIRNVIIFQGFKDSTV
jgi:hypothetical protein